MARHDRRYSNMKCRLGQVIFQVYTNPDTELFLKTWKEPVPSEHTWCLVPFQSSLSTIHLSSNTPSPTPSFGSNELMAGRGVHSLTEWLLWPLWSDKNTVFSSDFHHLLLSVSLNGVWESSRTRKHILLTRNPRLVSSYFTHHCPPLQPVNSLQLPAKLLGPVLSTHPTPTLYLKKFFFIRAGTKFPEPLTGV